MKITVLPKGGYLAWGIRTKDAGHTYARGREKEMLWTKMCPQIHLFLLVQNSGWQPIYVNSFLLWSRYLEVYRACSESTKEKTSSNLFWIKAEKFIWIQKVERIGAVNYSKQISNWEVGNDLDKKFKQNKGNKDINTSANRIHLLYI